MSDGMCLILAMGCSCLVIVVLMLRLMTLERQAAMRQQAQVSRADVSACSPTNPFGVCIAGDEPGWMAVDREVWRNFLNTETGQRFRLRLSFYEQGQNRKAVLLMNDKAGARAAGFHDCAAWLEALSADLTPLNNEDPNGFPPGVREAVERHTP